MGSLEQAIKNLKYRCKGRWLKLYLLLHGCKVGKGLKCVQFPNFRLVPAKNIQIGDNATIGENVTIEVVKGASLVIGNQVNLTRNNTIVVNKRIVVGDNCLIAENVSIRDANHGIKKNSLIMKQASSVDDVTIDEDVWIGANSVVLMGANIPKGVVVGANSLVLKKSQLEPYGVYAGNPVKFIKQRD